jgi:hypothetical protein
MSKENSNKIVVEIKIICENKDLKVKQIFFMALNNNITDEF